MGYVLGLGVVAGRGGVPIWGGVPDLFGDGMLGFRVKVTCKKHLYL